MAAVSAPEPTAEDIVVEAKITLPTEEEKIEIPQTEPLHKDIREPEPVPEEVPEIAKVLPTPESEREPLSSPEPTPVPAPSQTVADPQPGDMVYVPGFGWLECRGHGVMLKRLHAILERAGCKSGSTICTIHSCHSP